MYGTGCMRCLLITLNVLFAILGFIFLGAGVFLLAGGGLISSLADGVLSSLPNLAAQGSGSSDSTSAPPSMDLSVILGDTATAFIVIGCIVFFVCVFGAVAMCVNKRVLYITYVTVVGLLLLWQIVGITLFLTGVFDSMLKNSFKTMLLEKYGGMNNFTVESVVWNYLMLQFKCCGVDNYQDFYPSKMWDNQMSVTVAEGVTPIIVTLTTPLACCKVSGQFPSVTYLDKNCAVVPNSLNNNYMNGCWDAVYKSNLEAYLLYIIITCSVLALFQLMIIIAVVYITVQTEQDSIDKNKVEPISYRRDKEGQDHYYRDLGYSNRNTVVSKQDVHMEEFTTKSFKTTQ